MGIAGTDALLFAGPTPTDYSADVVRFVMEPDFNIPTKKTFSSQSTASPSTTWSGEVEVIAHSTFDDILEAEVASPTEGGFDFDYRPEGTGSTLANWVFNAVVAPAGEESDAESDEVISRVWAFTVEGTITRTAQSA